MVIGVLFKKYALERDNDHLDYTFDNHMFNNLQ